MPDDVALLPATRLIEYYRSRKLSPVEVIRGVFERVARYNSVLNAFCFLDEEGALSAARDSEARWHRGEPKGLLDGIPVSVKDLSFTIGWPTLRGSRAIRKEGPWKEDSPSVARAREDGAVLFGKTTVPEFASKFVTYSDLSGITRSPWDPAKTPGGSSGGAAASVASGMGPIALSSDAAGSIRVPCAFTGLFGLKPSFGLVPDYPPSYLGSLAVIGPITRTVQDAALALTVISRPDPRDPYSLPHTGQDFAQGLDAGVRGLRIAYSPTLGFARIDPEVNALVERGVTAFTDLGASVELVEKVFDDPSPIIWPLLAVGLANAFRWLGLTETDLQVIEPGLVQGAQQGARSSALDYLEVRRAEERLGAAMRQFHQKYDLLITPASVAPPFDADREPPEEAAATLTLNSGFNLTKQPAASVPCGLTRSGLPVGMQVVGPIYGDARVLSACYAYERVRPFPAPDMRKVKDFTASGATHTNGR